MEVRRGRDVGRKMFSCHVSLFLVEMCKYTMIVKNLQECKKILNITRNSLER